MKPIRRFLSMTLISFVAGTAAWAEQSAGAAGASPLPHPEILQVAPKTLAETPVSISATDAIASGEDKEIPRPGDHQPAAVKTAQSGKTVQSGNTLSRSKDHFSVVSELWPLLTVLVVIGALALLVKKFMPARQFSGGADVLRVIARTSVGPKQQLMLIKLGRKLLLVGVSPERINALTTVEDPTQVAMLLGEAASGRSDSMTRAFAASMSEESQAYEADESGEDVTEVTRGQVQGLLHKVRQLAGKGV